jgi:hypothetical protein
VSKEENEKLAAWVSTKPNISVFPSNYQISSATCKLVATQSGATANHDLICKDGHRNKETYVVWMNHLDVRTS